MPRGFRLKNAHRGEDTRFERTPGLKTYALHGGSWVVISGVISRANILITHIRGLITLLISTHEPPSINLGIELGMV